MRRALPKINLSPARKEHYLNLGRWLKTHNIEHKKLPIGFTIDIRNIPPHLEDEFIKVATFLGD